MHDIAVTTFSFQLYLVELWIVFFAFLSWLVLTLEGNHVGEMLLPLHLQVVLRSTP